MFAAHSGEPTAIQLRANGATPEMFATPYVSHQTDTFGFYHEGLKGRRVSL
jgi:hypothetical protein